MLKVKYPHKTSTTLDRSAKNFSLGIQGLNLVKIPEETKSQSQKQF